MGVHCGPGTEPECALSSKLSLPSGPGSRHTSAPQAQVPQAACSRAGFLSRKAAQAASRLCL